MAVGVAGGRRGVLAQDLRWAVFVTFLLVAGYQVSLTDDYVGLVEVAAMPTPVLVAGTLCLALRHVAPLSVLAVNVVANELHQHLGDHPPPLPLGIIVAVYTVAVVRGPLVGAAAAAATLLVLATGGLTGLAPLDDDVFYSDVVSIVAAVTAGYGVQLSRTHATLAEQRASRLAEQQEGRTREAVAAEQARIAREMHDLVAHDVSVIVAQAAAARRVLDRRPEAGASALASIEEVGREALDGLRSLVGLLRTEASEHLAPQPRLDQLPALVAQVERAGLPVTLTVRGQQRPLPAGVELNAYRIVQEALTNALKHAGPTRATVDIHYGDRSLEVQVRDAGRGALVGAPTGEEPGTDDPARGGHGLLGMRQRTAMLGGDLVAAPVDGVGFRVSARLPLTDGAAS